jgi:transcriptional regulator with XRE-family HTH domain
VLAGEGSEALAVSDRRPETPRYRPTAHTHSRDGIIAGYVLKLGRESASLTQPALAAALDVDTDTLQSWESGRRSLGATNVRDFVRLRLRLLHLGVAANLIDAIDDALSADYILGYVLRTVPEQTDPAEHPLAGWLLPRAVSSMLAWPLSGTPPSALRVAPTRPRRRGPVPTGPTLTGTERERFYAHLRGTADRMRIARLAHHDQRALFTHQAYYRAGWDRSPASTRWLRQAYATHTRGTDPLLRWSADWLAARALVIALSCHGDPEPLRHFVRAGHQSDQTEIANLNYWAYWIGELGERQQSHHFMPRADVFDSWSGARLTAHLVGRLRADPDVELNIHTLARLLDRPAPRHFLEHDAALASALRVAVDQLTAGPEHVSPHARRELDRIVTFTAAAVPRAARHGR